MFRKIMVIGLLPILVTSMSVSAQVQTQNAEPPDIYSQFVTNFKDTAVSIHEKLTEESERHRAFCSLVNTRADIVAMARFAMGRNLRLVSDDEIKPFYSAFRNMLASLLGRAFADLKGKTVLVDAYSRAVGEDHIVNVSVENSKTGRGTRIQFRIVAKPDQALKLLDASLDGISLLSAKRSEIEAIFRRATDEGRGGMELLLSEINSRFAACPE